MKGSLLFYPSKVVWAGEGGATYLRLPGAPISFLYSSGSKSMLSYLADSASVSGATLKYLIHLFVCFKFLSYKF